MSKVAVPPIKRGLNIPISGSPESRVIDGPTISHVGLVGDDYVGMKPTMQVVEGDVGIELLHMEAFRVDALLEGHLSLQQPDKARSRFEMAEIRLRRADRAAHLSARDLHRRQQATSREDT